MLLSSTYIQANLSKLLNTRWCGQRMKNKYLKLVGLAPAVHRLHTISPTSRKTWTERTTGADTARSKYRLKADCVVRGGGRRGEGRLGVRRERKEREVIKCCTNWIHHVWPCQYTTHQDCHSTVAQKDNGTFEVAFLLKSVKPQHAPTDVKEDEHCQWEGCKMRER